MLFFARRYASGTLLFPRYTTNTFLRVPNLSSEATVYLVDSSIYIYRAWHLMPKSLTDATGDQVNALHGFAAFLIQLLDQARSRNVICAFDHESRPTLRQKIFAAYKSDRPATPPGLRRQFPLCEQLVTLMGIAGISIAGYEADDIIATLAQLARDRGRQVFVISADKDLTQCIRDQDVYWDFAKSIMLDKRGIEKRFGVKPEQIADLLALSGDKADAVPGVPGVGPATAARLLKKWGNIDILFTRLDAVAQMKFRGAWRVAQLLSEHEQQIRQSRRICGLFFIDALAKRAHDFSMGSAQSALHDFLRQHGFNQDQQQRLLRAVEP